MKTIFATGFIQVFLVTAQTWFIARDNLPAVGAFGFAISLVWTMNVRRVAVSGLGASLAYASGASTGAVVGLLLARAWK